MQKLPRLVQNGGLRCNFSGGFYPTMRQPLLIRQHKRGCLPRCEASFHPISVKKFLVRKVLNGLLRCATGGGRPKTAGEMTQGSAVTHSARTSKDSQSVARSQFTQAICHWQKTNSSRLLGGLRRFLHPSPCRQVCSQRVRTDISAVMFQSHRGVERNRLDVSSCTHVHVKAACCRACLQVPCDCLAVTRRMAKGKFKKGCQVRLDSTTSQARG